MRKILVSLISAILIVACVLSVSSCSIIDAAVSGVDLVLGASGGLFEKNEGGEDAEDATFAFTSMYAIPEEYIPVIDVPDPTPATEGLSFVLNDAGTAYVVLAYTNHKLPPAPDQSAAVLATEVYIPYSYNGLPVVSIANAAFAETAITSITLPKTLVAIGEKAFFGSSVPAVNIPASVLHIADDAFIECNALASITVESGNTRYTVDGNYLVDGAAIRRGFGNGEIPSYITEIGDNAFKGCDAITSVTIPASVTKIGDAAFASCRNLTEAVVDASVSALPNNMFDGCSSLASVTLSDSISTISFAAFRGTGFTSYTVPSGITAIESSAFAECSAMTELNFSLGLVKIGGSAFQNCIRLTSVILPSGLNYIGAYAFSGCLGLTTVKFPNTVQTICSGAFYGCERLQSVHIPKSVTVMGTCVFYGVDATFSVSIETSYVPTKWVTNWDVRLVENALESGKIATVAHRVTLHKSVTPPTE